jgi:hypothetical protein
VRPLAFEFKMMHPNLRQLSLALLTSIFAVLLLVQDTPARQTRSVSRIEAEQDPLACVFYMAAALEDTTAQDESVRWIMRKAAKLGMVDRSLSLLPLTDQTRALLALPHSCSGVGLEPETIQRLMSELHKVKTDHWSYEYGILNLIEGCVFAGHYELADSIASRELSRNSYWRQAFLALSDTCAQRGLTDLSLQYLRKAAQVPSLPRKDIDARSLCDVASRFWKFGFRDEAIKLAIAAKAAAVLDSTCFDGLGCFRSVIQLLFEFGLGNDARDLIEVLDTVPEQDYQLAGIVTECLQANRRDLALHAASFIQEYAMQTKSVAEIAQSYVDSSQVDSALAVVVATDRLPIDTLVSLVRAEGINQLARAYYQCGRNSIALARLMSAFHRAVERPDKDIYIQGPLLAIIAAGALELGFLDSARVMLACMPHPQFKRYAVFQAYRSLAKQGLVDQAELALSQLDNLEQRRQAREEYAYRRPDYRLADSLLDVANEGMGILADSEVSRMIDEADSLSFFPSPTVEEQALDTDLPFPSSYLYRPLLAKLARAYLRFGDTASAELVAGDVLGMLGSVDRDWEGDSVVCDVLSLCSEVGDPSALVRITPSMWWFRESLFPMIISCYAKANMWQQCLEAIPEITSDRHRRIVMLNLASWYYILQPDTVDKQSDFLQKLVAASEK